MDNLNLKGSTFLYTLYISFSLNRAFLYSYQNILVENPRPIFHPCRVHFHRAVTQLAVDCINTAWSDSEVITVAIALIYT